MSSENVLQPLLEETRKDGLAEVTCIGDYVELSLTGLLQRADEEIGKVTDEKEAGVQGADGRLVMAEDRRDFYWLYVVTNCTSALTLQEPIKDPARFPWREVTKVTHYWLHVNAMTKPMQVREDQPSYGTKDQE
jgi:hypothetical protein